LTLIIGIRCREGIVVAGDGAAQYAVMGRPTAQAATVRKLKIVHNKIIVGVSGPVGLAQRLTAHVEEGYAAGRYGGRAETAIGVMRSEFWRLIVEPEYNVALSAGRLIGAQIAMAPAISAMVVAMPFDAGAELIQFDQQCAPELASDDLPCVAIGSGQPMTDPFLAFLRLIFFPRRVPSVQDGVFCAVWALQHAIDTMPGGVAEPKQVIVLERKGQDWEARELPTAEIDIHVDAVRDAERTLTDWRSQFSATPAGAPPAAPPAAPVSTGEHKVVTTA
jgi:20S proteasome alpha/beta subunit